MKFVVDKNIPMVEKAFEKIGEIKAIETGTFTPESVRDADVLIIRSETRITQSLLNRSQVKFIGTVTAGTDHINTVM